MSFQNPSHSQSHSGPGSELDRTDLEEPPPYTPTPTATSGETTIEVGPRRPFQTVPEPANPQRNGVYQPQSQVSHGRIPSSSSSPLPSRRSPPVSIVQQLSDSFANIVNGLNSSASHHANANNWGGTNIRPTWQSNDWTSYPGQNARPTLPPPPPGNAQLAPPPRHPLSALQPPPLSTSTQSLPSMANHTSDFARDFYAAGAGSGEALVTENHFAPPVGPPPNDGRPTSQPFAAPAGPPPSDRQTSATPNDGRPTSQPQPGHPLLKDGNLLVYPKGFECRKCMYLFFPPSRFLAYIYVPKGHNVGYKDANPLKPCKHCWKKYAKPFTGPLVYSFPSNTASSSLASNFQKPLPLYASSPVPPISSSSSPNINYGARSSGHTHNHHGRFRNPGLMPPTPPSTSNAVTYMAGDPRIGGSLCLRCGGRGNIEVFLFDQETCPVCSGVGRVF